MSLLPGERIQIKTYYTYKQDNYFIHLKEIKLTSHIDYISLQYLVENIKMKVD